MSTKERRPHVGNPDLTERIGAIEGAPWLESGNAQAHFRASLHHWSASKDSADYDFDQAVIYGAGGMHRYFIQADGEVVFSGSHAASSKYLAKAVAAGFRCV